MQARAYGFVESGLWLCRILGLGFVGSGLGLMGLGLSQHYLHVVVSLNRGAPAQTPIYYGPYYCDRKMALVFLWVHLDAS